MAEHVLNPVEEFFNKNHSSKDGKFSSGGGSGGSSRAAKVAAVYARAKQEAKGFKLGKFDEKANPSKVGGSAKTAASAAAKKAGAEIDRRAPAAQRAYDKSAKHAAKQSPGDVAAYRKAVKESNANPTAANRAALAKAKKAVGLSAEHVFESPRVEEFYNSCHTKVDGTFCGVGAKGRGITRVPMSAAAARSNAILRGVSSARKSPQYKQAKKAMGGSWARREHGQGGNIGKGSNSAKADRARAANAQGKNPANKDKSDKLVGGYKHTGNKAKDMIQISRLDRGSAARKAATKKFEAAYGKEGKLSVQQKAARGIPIT